MDFVGVQTFTAVLPKKGKKSTKTQSTTLAQPDTTHTPYNDASILFNGNGHSGFPSSYATEDSLPQANGKDFHRLQDASNHANLFSSENDWEFPTSEQSKHSQPEKNALEASPARELSFTSVSASNAVDSTTKPFAPSSELPSAASLFSQDDGQDTFDFVIAAQERPSLNESRQATDNNNVTPLEQAQPSVSSDVSSLFGAPSAGDSDFAFTTSTHDSSNDFLSSLKPVTTGPATPPIEKPSDVNTLTTSVENTRTQTEPVFTSSTELLAKSSEVIAQPEKQPDASSLFGAPTGDSEWDIDFNNLKENKPAQIEPVNQNIQSQATQTNIFESDTKSVPPFKPEDWLPRPPVISSEDLWSGGGWTPPTTIELEIPQAPNQTTPNAENTQNTETPAPPLTLSTPETTETEDQSASNQLNTSKDDLQEVNLTDSPDTPSNQPVKRKLFDIPKTPKALAGIASTFIKSLASELKSTEPDSNDDDVIEPPPSTNSFDITPQAPLDNSTSSGEQQPGGFSSLFSLASSLITRGSKGKHEPQPQPVQVQSPQDEKPPMPESPTYNEQANLSANDTTTTSQNSPQIAPPPISQTKTVEPPPASQTKSVEPPPVGGGRRRDTSRSRGAPRHYVPPSITAVTSTEATTTAPLPIAVPRSTLSIADNTPTAPDSSNTNPTPPKETSLQTPAIPAPTPTSAASEPPSIHTKEKSALPSNAPQVQPPPPASTIPPPAGRSRRGDGSNSSATSGRRFVHSLIPTTTTSAKEPSMVTKPAIPTVPQNIFTPSVELESPLDKNKQNTSRLSSSSESTPPEVTPQVHKVYEETPQRTPTPIPEVDSSPTGRKSGGLSSLFAPLIPKALAALSSVAKREDSTGLNTQPTPDHASAREKGDTTEDTFFTVSVDAASPVPPTTRSESRLAPADPVPSNLFGPSTEPQPFHDENTSTIQPLASATTQSPEPPKKIKKAESSTHIDITPKKPSPLTQEVKLENEKTVATANKELLERIASLERQNAELKLKNEGLESRNQQLTSDLQRSEAARIELERKLSEIQLDLMERDSALQLLRAQSVELARLRAALNRSTPPSPGPVTGEDRSVLKKYYEDKLKSMQSKIDEQTSQIEALQQTVNELTRAKQEAAARVTQLEETRSAEQSTFMSQIESITDEKRALEAKLASQAETIRSLTAENQVLRQEGSSEKINALQKALEQTKKELSSAELKASADEHKISILVSEKEAIEREYEEQRKLHASALEQLIELRNVVESLQLERTHLSEVVAQLRAQIASYESHMEVQTQLTAKQTQVIENLMNENAQLINALDFAKRISLESKEQGQLEAMYKERNYLLQTVSQLQNEVQSLKEENALLTEKLAASVAEKSPASVAEISPASFAEKSIYTIPYTPNITSAYIPYDEAAQYDAHAEFHASQTSSPPSTSNTATSDKTVSEAPAPAPTLPDSVVEPSTTPSEAAQTQSQTPKRRGWFSFW